MEGDVRLPATAGSGVSMPQVHDNGILPASDHHGLARLVCLRVNFLVRNERWDIDEVARPRFVAELQLLAPTHSGPAADDVQDCLELRRGGADTVFAPG